ncbi:MAG: hypothetical protein ABIQ11_05145 [Saprospiraceae bacterium]
MDANKKAHHHKPRSTTAMWHLAFSYARLQDCEQAKRYLDLYEKHTPKKYLNDEYDTQVKLMLASCE